MCLYGSVLYPRLLDYIRIFKPSPRFHIETTDAAWTAGTLAPPQPLYLISYLQHGSRWIHLSKMSKIFWELKGQSLMVIYVPPYSHESLVEIQWERVVEEQSPK